ncbi:C-type lectin domain family 4 member F-like [Neocloeon triangulifer]|uniref:C-type lectin domain family 4 member F-like n=1 Tax=Neocloeon triangulifer TaxID=2078957 RepID=UPI00286ECD41|nr:C-type lectin domain family 4 member F-like [Neocloeon triangulifer]
MDRFWLLMVVGLFTAQVCDLQQIEHSVIQECECANGVKRLEKFASKFENWVVKETESKMEISTQLSSLLTLVGSVLKRQESLEKKFENSDSSVECKSLLQQISNLTKDAETSQKQFDQMVSKKDEEIKLQQQLILILKGKIGNSSVESDELLKDTSCERARLANLTLLPNGKKYLFSHSSFVDWNSANESCVKQGLHLATIVDLNDAQIVANQGQRVKQVPGWWVSAKNFASGDEKDFRWQDGTNLALDSPLWVNNAGDEKRGCVLIYNYNVGFLNSNPCTSERHFICQLPAECD